jgi:glyoxylase-like metal-dependent hydrolase (beta-lactamase superfamily II)
MESTLAGTDPGLEERKIGAVTVLFGAKGGKYPDGNSLWVEGRQESLIIDPSLGVVARRDRLPRVDRVLNSHCHEDHIAGNHLFPNVPWHLHEEDLPGIQSLDNMMGIYGFTPEVRKTFEKVVVDRFHYRTKPDAQPFRDGDVFELGEARVRVIHSPGHTRGHSFFFIEPDEVLYLGDVDLSSFGPYYGDAWSDLEDFERTLKFAREIRARHYATFHHIGVIDDRETFIERIDRFAAVIQSRESRLLDYLEQPHSLDEIAEHRFVYRPGDDVAFAAPVEARSMGQHVQRLIAAGKVREVESGRYLAMPGS